MPGKGKAYEESSGLDSRHAASNNLFESFAGFFFFLILLLPSKQETENYKRMIEFGIGSSQGATLSPYAEDKIGLWAPDAPVTLLPRLFTQCICLC